MWRQRGILIIKWTVIAGLGAAAVIVLERLALLGVPVVTGFPFGHERGRNAALPVGARVRLDAEHGALTMLESLTATSGPGRCA